jgi:hypothetical protein
MDLSKEDVLLLIQEYEKKDVLWDSSHRWHFNNEKKMDAWREICNVIPTTVDDAKRKVASLLGSYRREKSKEIKCQGTGKGKLLLLFSGLVINYKTIRINRV